MQPNARKKTVSETITGRLHTLVLFGCVEHAIAFGLITNWIQEILYPESLTGADAEYRELVFHAAPAGRVQSLCYLASFW